MRTNVSRSENILPYYEFYADEYGLDGVASIGHVNSIRTVFDLSFSDDPVSEIVEHSINVICHS